mmetsp:Transcript_11033/g.31795  ORF Transcript_11033/g.31795 Transcript_11033/m.31795 type:complete len:207 (+) Transcript_11033:92-712(+)
MTDKKLCSILRLDCYDYPSRSIRCIPLLVSTMFLVSSPTFSPKLASSKAGCILRRPKNPKSPPRLADEQSDSVRASSSNVACSSAGLSSSSIKISKSPCNSSLASSLVCVIFGCLQLLGLLESLCFFRMCRTRTCFGSSGLLEEAAAGALSVASVFRRLADRSSVKAGGVSEEEALSFSLLAIFRFCEVFAVVASAGGSQLHVPVG